MSNYSDYAPMQQSLMLDINSLSPRTLAHIQQHLESRTEDVYNDIVDLQRTVVVSNQALSAAFNIGMTAERASQLLPQEEQHFRGIVDAANQLIVEVVYNGIRGRK